MKKQVLFDKYIIRFDLNFVFLCIYYGFSIGKRPLKLLFSSELGSSLVLLAGS